MVGVSLNAALARYVVKRVLFMVPTLLGILLVTFALIQFVPGGPVEQMVQAEIARIVGKKV